jgi:ABC-type glycerol-3-phosphate transport system substrate-binding protein
MPVGDFTNKDAMENDIENYKNVYPPVAVQDNIFNNRIYGIPTTFDKLVLYTNPQIIQNALINYAKTHSSQDVSEMSNVVYYPKTWDDLVKIDQLVTQKTGNKITQSAIALGTSNNISVSSDILTLLMMQNGTKMVSDDLGTAEFNTAQNLFGNIQYPGTKALTFYSSFADPKSPNYTWNSSMDDSIQAFAEGKTAMLIDYGSATQEIQRLTPNLQFQANSIPQISQTANPINFVKYDTMAVAKTTKIPKTAWNFVLEATSASYVGAYDSISRKTSMLGVSDQDVFNAVSWYNPNPDQVEAIFKDAIQQVNNNKDIQTAMDGAAGQVTTLLNNLKQTQTQ